MTMLLVFACGGLLLSARAHAHGSSPAGELGHLYTPDPAVIVPLALFAGAYLGGILRLWRRAGSGHGVPEWRLACFIGGMLAMVLALIWPLDALGDVSLAAHMAQHVMLTVVAAPLLVLSAPAVACLWAFPAGWRANLGRFGSARGTRSIRQVLTSPVFAWSFYASMLWLWHMPPLYQAALRDNAIHLAEHSAFFISAALLWWSVVHSVRGRSYGASSGVAVLFGTALQSGLLGALLTFAPQPLYPLYETAASPFGIGALQDQQLAGTLMWIPGGFVYMAAGLAVTYRWLLSAPYGGR